MLISTILLLQIIRYTISQIYEVPVYDYLYGTTFMDVTIGSPGQVLFIQFDTGSFWTGVDCQFDYNFNVPNFYGGVNENSQGVEKRSVIANSLDMNGNNSGINAISKGDHSLTMNNNDCDFPQVFFNTSIETEFQASGSRTSEWVKCDKRCMCNRFQECELRCVNFISDSPLNEYHQENVHTWKESSKYPDLHQKAYLQEHEIMKVFTQGDLGHEDVSESPNKHFSLDHMTYIPPKSISHYTSVRQLPEVIQNSHHYNLKIDLEETDNPMCYAFTSYLDGSYIAGNIFSDYLSFGDIETFTPYFYADKIICGIHFGNNKDFHGIVGSGKGIPNLDNQLMDKYFKNYSDKSYIFGLCSNWEGHGGVITFGGYNSSYFANPDTTIHWQHIRQSSPFYELFDISLEFNGLQVNTPSKLNLIIDTGSTLTVLPLEMYKSILRQLKDACLINNISFSQRDMLYIITHNTKVLDILPTIKFYGKDKSVSFFEMEPRQYLRKHRDGYFFIIVSNDNLQNFGVIGSLAMRNQYVLFDKSNSQIAFVKSNCPQHYMEERVTNDKSKYLSKSNVPEIILLLAGILLATYPSFLMTQKLSKVAKKLFSGHFNRRVTAS